mmetsp:Transcript_48837/g.81076  ORF Transcript_48837/g.81076 Transcript_48837/m.81076 type:complete len:350 (+) Transcript_48837:33-1082(+)
MWMHLLHHKIPHLDCRSISVAGIGRFTRFGNFSFPCHGSIKSTFLKHLAIDAIYALTRNQLFVDIAGNHLLREKMRKIMRRAINGKQVVIKIAFCSLCARQMIRVMTTAFVATQDGAWFCAHGTRQMSTAFNFSLDITKLTAFVHKHLGCPHHTLIVCPVRQQLRLFDKRSNKFVLFVEEHTLRGIITFASAKHAFFDLVNLKTDLSHKLLRFDRFFLHSVFTRFGPLAMKKMQRLQSIGAVLRSAQGTNPWFGHDNVVNERRVEWNDTTRMKLCCAIEFTMATHKQSTRIMTDFLSQFVGFFFLLSCRNQHRSRLIVVVAMLIETDIAANELPDIATRQTFVLGPVTQ